MARWDEKTALTKRPERLTRIDLNKRLKNTHPDIYDEWYINGY